METTPNRHRAKPARSHAQHLQALSVIARRCVLLAMLWALAELPWELVASNSVVEASALLCAKLIFLAFARLTLKGVGWARTLFALICGLSIWAIAPSLLTECQRFPTGFIFSLGELLTKGIALLGVYGRLDAMVRAGTRKSEPARSRTHNAINAWDFEQR